MNHPSGYNAILQLWVSAIILATWYFVCTLKSHLWLLRSHTCGYSEVTLMVSILEQSSSWALKHFFFCRLVCLASRCCGPETQKKPWQWLELTRRLCRLPMPNSWRSSTVSLNRPLMIWQRWRESSMRLLLPFMCIREIYSMTWWVPWIWFDVSMKYVVFYLQMNVLYMLVEHIQNNLKLFSTHVSEPNSL